MSPSLKGSGPMELRLLAHGGASLTERDIFVSLQGLSAWAVETMELPGRALSEDFVMMEYRDR